VSRQKLGQHFLTDQNVIQAILDSVDPIDGGVTIEIGPGRGAITSGLIEKSDRLILIEFDDELATSLDQKYSGDPNVRVIHDDARTFGPELDPWLRESEFIVVGNLPYYAANPITRNFLETTRKPQAMTIMVQREVAEDMAATPGDMSLLSLAVQIYADPQHVVDAPPESFNPPPKVHSSVIRLTPVDKPKIRFASEDDFFTLARAGFKSPRKQLHNSLSDGLFIPLDEARSLVEKANLETTRRPATLSLDEWQVLYDVWVEADRPKQVAGSVRRKRGRRNG
jgi:16S rRNA (adenine1518-N6/adenine1519-N6)-dimethyltransferase